MNLPITCELMKERILNLLMQYIQYSKLKRIIKRKRFIADRDEAIADAEFSSSGRKSATSSSKNPAGEYTPLESNSKLSGSYENETPSFSVPRFGNDDESDSDFFKVILSEIEKVNKFFLGYD